MTQRRFRLNEAQLPERHGWRGLLPRIAVRRRNATPQALPERPADAESYVHMRYARTLPLHVRGDWRASRQRAALALVVPILNGLAIEPTRPLSILKLLNRAGFVPARDADLSLLLTALSEMATQLGWRVYERHAALTHDERETRIRWPDEDLCVAPGAGSALLFVRIAGNGLQLAIYQKEPLSQSA